MLAGCQCRTCALLQARGLAEQQRLQAEGQLRAAEAAQQETQQSLNVVLARAERLQVGSAWLVMALPTGRKS